MVVYKFYRQWKKERVVIYKTHLFLITILSFLISLTQVHAGFAKTGKYESKNAIMKKTLKICLPFITNEGQILDNDNNVRFYANTFGGTVYVTKTGEIVYSLPKLEKKERNEVKCKQTEQRPYR